jgi:hypothetical protein
MPGWQVRLPGHLQGRAAKQLLKVGGQHIGIRCSLLDEPQRDPELDSADGQRWEQLQHTGDNVEQHALTHVPSAHEDVTVARLLMLGAGAEVAGFHTHTGHSHTQTQRTFLKSRLARKMTQRAAG